MSSLAPTLQAFFTDRLLCQRGVSPNTVASYRDTFRLLLSFAQEKTRKPPARLELEDLDAPLIAAFLEHLETERGNSKRTRNIRLAAVRSFFHYAALRHPERAAVIQRVLAIPTKRSDQRIVTFLTPEEVKALLASPDRTTWAGRRDHALLLTAAQTGLRISETIAGLPAATCSSAPAPICERSAKDAKNASLPSPARPLLCCARGCVSAKASLTTRCFPPATADHSPATRSNAAWPSTWPPRSGNVRHCAPST